MLRNVSIYPWFQAFRNLTFWQATWFLYFQQELSASEAILLYAVYDVATTALEVPSGWMSDRVGRRFTLIASAITGFVAMLLLAIGGSFAMFVLGQVMLGASMAFASGTDSALLYESLEGEGRGDEIERYEVLSWRASFTALALSAVIGGWMAGIAVALPYWAAAAAGLVVVALAFAFVEPPHATRDTKGGGAWFATPDARPVLLWILGFSVAMYGLNHVPFVFGQPFILEALDRVGWSQDAPLVSGGITSAMMVISVAVSLVAVSVRRALGLMPLLLIALAIQVGLIAGLSQTAEVLAIGLLMLRMVPNALTTAFVVARIQPLLTDGRRATWLSIQSFAGRLILAATMAGAASSVSGEGALPMDELQSVLSWYAVLGLAVLVALGVTAARVNRRA